MREDVSGDDEEACYKRRRRPQKVNERKLNKITIVGIKSEASIVHLAESVGEMELKYCE